MSDGVVAALHAVGVKRAAANESMARHTSWKIGGPADYYCVVEDEGQLLAALQIARENGLPWLVLGGGYNVLVADAGVEGMVIVNRLRGIAIEDSTDGAEVRAGAGVFFARAAQYTASHGYAGMEWGISIPGTVGGGVVNNAGAHWSDVSRSLLWATAVDGAGAAARFTASDLSYQYRRSALKTAHSTESRVVVTGCCFRLYSDSAERALARIEELRQHRLRTQPVKEASAGSTFKNPPGEHAGALVERAGLKGFRIGGAQIAPMHANFILNTGGATARDIVELIRTAQGRVLETFGITLEPEIQFIGRWPGDLLRAVFHEAA